MKRWERQRSKWLRSHARGYTLSDQRMAAKLKRRADALDRKETGAEESGMSEIDIPWIGARFISHGEDPKEKFFRMLTLAVVTVGTVLLAGPAIIAAKALYGLQWLVLPMKNKALRAWPWLVLAGIAAVVGPFLVPIGWFVLISPWPPSVGIDQHIAGPMWLWLQVVLTFLLTAARIRNGGWPGVKPPKVVKEGKKKLPQTPVPTAPAAPAIKPIPEVPMAKADASAAVPEVQDDEDDEWQSEGPVDEPAFEEPAEPQNKTAVPVVPAGNYQKES